MLTVDERKNLIHAPHMFEHMLSTDFKGIHEGPSHHPTDPIHNIQVDDRLTRGFAPQSTIL